MRYRFHEKEMLEMSRNEFISDLAQQKESLFMNIFFPVWQWSMSRLFSPGYSDRYDCCLPRRYTYPQIKAMVDALSFNELFVAAGAPQMNFPETDINEWELMDMHIAWDMCERIISVWSKSGTTEEREFDKYKPQIDSSLDIAFLAPSLESFLITAEEYRRETDIDVIVDAVISGVPIEDALA